MKCSYLSGEVTFSMKVFSSINGPGVLLVRQSICKNNYIPALFVLKQMYADEALFLPTLADTLLSLFLLNMDINGSISIIAVPVFTPLLLLFSIFPKGDQLSVLPKMLLHIMGLLMGSIVALEKIKKIKDFPGKGVVFC